jgi:outer membrane receptor protein involved in Fe transport
MQAPTRYSITPIAAAVTTALYPGFTALAQQADDDDRGLEEIIVTATKREVSVQDIPATIQAITQESLAAMGAKGMEDYARFVPSVNVVTTGPGSSTVVFRGAITGADYIGQATSSVYLDEISVTQTGAQPSIRAVDIERVEALSGPQGTLYGSDAQAGTMRMLTNQPIMNTFEGIFDGEVRGGGDSDMSYRGSLVFNIPLVEDKLAMRIVGYNERDGGFIDNVLGHTADQYGLDPTDLKPSPSQWGTLDNAHALDKNWNEEDVYGGRIHLKWDMTENWSTTLSYHHQTSDAGAANYYDPFVGDLQVIRFHDEYRNEEFNMGSLKIEGDLGFAQLIAAFSYYDRSIDGMDDITTYAHYWASGYCHDSNYTPAYIDANPQYFPYYTSANVWPNPDTGYVVWWPVYCQGTTVDSDFYSSYPYFSEDDKFTTEIRLQSSGDTFDWIVGAYYEDSKDSWLAPFATPTTGGPDGTGADNLYQQSVSLQYWEWYFSNYYGTPTTLPNATSHWSSGSHTDWEQTAIFGEVTWHINDELNLTVGGRYFDRSNENFYFVNHPGGTNFNEGEPDTTVDTTRQFRVANDLRPFGRKGQEDQIIPKVSLSYAFGDDQMVYGLYTQGVRQGGVNRSRGQPFFPSSYESDLMNNYEMGYKSNFADGRGRFNVTGYYMLWEDYQLSIVDPSQEPCPDPNDEVAGVCGQPWQQVIANLGEAHIQGVNVEIDYTPNENWLLGMNYEWMEAETDTAHDLDPDEPGPELVKGLRLPLVPSSKASAWIEYHTPTDFLGGDTFFIRTQWSHTGDSLNILEPLDNTDPNPQLYNPSYIIGDIRAGIVGEDWQVDLFINNVTDERATYTHQTGLFEWGAAQTVEGRAHHQTVFTNRPTEIGIRYMKRWGD